MRKRIYRQRHGPGGREVTAQDGRTARYRASPLLSARLFNAAVAAVAVVAFLFLPSPPRFDPVLTELARLHDARPTIRWRTHCMNRRSS